MASVSACDSSDRNDSAGAALTDRATAAVALDHVPGVTDMVRGESVPGEPGHGAYLEYRREGQEYDEVLEVRVFEADPELDIDCADDASFEGCFSRSVPEGTLTVAWDETVTDEDPGRVMVELAADDRLVYAIYSGPTVTGDPRAQARPVSVSTLEAIARDHRLAFRTTRQVVEAGEAIEDWGVQQHPDTVEVPRVG
ncbi:hypothetical protein [Nocardioides sp. 503]|uniref:hypothetical protein n=1 Tax=Nocardioides sp. 503 TaxID=2508326 RepID=UPI00106F4B5C|nr:hypothetical protein [Nocardioides sp. 503]